MHIQRTRGFAFVELLVINAIIGILVGLLLPAVQSAREAGRNAQASDDPRVQAVGEALRDLTDGTSNTAVGAIAALEEMSASGSIDRSIIAGFIVRTREHRRDIDTLLDRIRRLHGSEGNDRFSGTDRRVLRDAAAALLDMRRGLRIVRHRLGILLRGAGQDR